MTVVPFPARGTAGTTAVMRSIAASLFVLLVALPARAQTTETPPAETTTEATPTETTEATPPAEATTESTPAPALQLLVIDAATYGIDPIVGRVATDVIRRTAASMGYGVVDGPTTVGFAQRAHMPYPPTPADLWRTTWTAQVHRGVFARIWAEGGRYVIEIIVASLDGAGPFFGRDTASADELRDVVTRLTESAVPPVSQWNASGVPASPTAPTPPPQTAPVQAPPHRARTELGQPQGRDGRRWHRPEPELRRFSLTLQTESSIGTTQGSFYNHFAGARVDVRITRDFMVGGYFAYVNLEGRAQRQSNFYVQIDGEFRIRPVATLDLTLPLRVGIGYLPYNGPVARVSAGLNYAFDANWEIGADLLVPTFYFLPAVGRVAVAFDFALEVGYRF
jgi:hypothetical protein